MITPRPNAPAGAVSRTRPFTPLPSCAVLCRNNAPLTAFAMNLVRRSTPVCVLGRDFGSGLERLIDELKPTSVSDLRQRLAEWAGGKLRRARTDRTREAIEDQVKSLSAVITGAKDNTITGLKTAISRLFLKTSSDPNVVVCATGHKAKGLEWDHVFILDSHLIPSKWAETAADLKQERNLLYVMVTRAKETVTYIRSEA